MEIRKLKIIEILGTYTSFGFGEDYFFRKEPILMTLVRELFEKKNVHTSRLK